MLYPSDNFYSRDNLSYGYLNARCIVVALIVRSLAILVLKLIISRKIETFIWCNL